MLFRQMLQRFWKKDPKVVFDVTFDGSEVNTNHFTKTDSQTGNPHISVSGGNLVIAATPGEGWAQTALVSKAPWFWNRVPGLTIEWEVTPGATSTYLAAGFTDDTLAADAREAHSFEFRAANGAMYIEADLAAPILTPFVYTATSTWLRIVLLSAGALYYVSTDNRVTWKLIWKDASITTTPLYAFIESYSAALTASACRVYLGSPRPANVSASPGAPALVAGAELVVNGNMETGDPPSSWSGTPTLAGVADERTGGAGAQALKQTTVGNVYSKQDVAALAVGTWYAISGWRKSISVASGIGFGSAAEGATRNYFSGYDSPAAWAAVNGAFRAAYADTQLALFNQGAGETRYDDISLKPFPFDQTGVLEYIADAGQHDGIYDCAPTVSAGYHAGIVCHANSATAPSYYLHAYVDRTAAKAYLLKVENNTTTELIGAAITYSAGAQLRVVSVGTKHALYYNGAIVGTVQTVDVSSNYGLSCHSFQTSASDSVGVCAVNGGT